MTILLQGNVVSIESTSWMTKLQTFRAVWTILVIPNSTWVLFWTSMRRVIHSWSVSMLRKMRIKKINLAKLMSKENNQTRKFPNVCKIWEIYFRWFVFVLFTNNQYCLRYHLHHHPSTKIVAMSSFDLWDLILFRNHQNSDDLCFVYLHSSSGNMFASESHCSCFYASPCPFSTWIAPFGLFSIYCCEIIFDLFGLCKQK